MTTAPAPSRSRVVDDVVDVLTDDIVTGKFQPGDHLPPERELAEILDVNRTSLRQALSRLEHIGLIKSRQGHGTVVLGPFASSDPRVMSKVIRHAGPSLMADLFEVRTGFVKMSARAAAQRASDADLASLRAILDGILTQVDPGSIQSAEMDWFSRLVEAGGNRVLGSLVVWFGFVYGDAGQAFEAAFADPVPIHSDLSVVMDALDQRDPDAAESAMADYAVAGALRMVSAIGAVQGLDGVQPDEGAGPTD